MFCQLALVLLFTSCGTGYEIVQKDFPTEQTTINSDASKEDLFKLSHLWMRTALKNNIKGNISEDINSGMLAGKVLIDGFYYNSTGLASGYSNSAKTEILGLTQIDVKNNQAQIKIDIEPFTVIESNYLETSGLNDDEIKNQLNNLMDSYKNFISNHKIIKTNFDTKEQVINIENKKKNDLYVIANKWMVEKFNNAKSVVQFSDKEAGVVTGKYLIGEVFFYEQQDNSGKDVFALITIEVKDEAAKISLNPDDLEYLISNNLKEKSGLNKEKLENHLEVLASSFESYLKNNQSSF